MVKILQTVSQYQPQELKDTLKPLNISSLTGFMLNLINNEKTNKQMAIEILSNLLEGTNTSIHKLLT